MMRTIFQQRLREQKKEKGYSLLEMVIYIGVFAFLSVVVVNSLLITTSSFLKIRTERNLNNTALVSMERVIRETRLANNVQILNSTFNVNPGRLTLDTRDGAGLPKTVEFYVSDGRLRVRENGADTGALTPSNIELQDLKFRLITNGSVQAVKVEMTLRDTRVATSSPRSFYNTALLRGSY
ncbi:MAG: hypothetical protein AAB523_00745 [Patescibacteria group bacterium]